MDDYLGVSEDPGNAPSYTVIVKNNQYHFYDINSDDPNVNEYNRDKIIYDIKELIDCIQGMKKMKEIMHGYYWNDWRRWHVTARCTESVEFDAYLNMIEANLEHYHTRTLLHIKKELYRFWRAL